MAKAKVSKSKLTDRQAELYNALSPQQRDTLMGVLRGLKPHDAYYKAGGTGSKPAASAYVSRLIRSPKGSAFLAAMRGEEIESASNVAILTKEQALKELSKIAQTSFHERNRIAAIKQLAEMQRGWNTPTQQEVEIPKGITHKYSPEDYKKAAEAMSEHFRD